MDNRHVIHHALMTRQLASRSPHLRSQILSGQSGNGGHDAVHPPSQKSHTQKGVARSCTDEDVANRHAHNGSCRGARRDLRPLTLTGTLSLIGAHGRPTPSETGSMAAHDGGHAQRRSCYHRATVPRAGLSSRNYHHSGAIFSSRRTRCR